MARHYLNEAAPCNSDETLRGDGILQVFIQHITKFSNVEIVSFKGAPKFHGKALLETMLHNGDFDEAVKNNEYSSVGVSCSCHPEEGMECMMVFASDVQRDRSIGGPQWLKRVPKAACSAYCFA